MDSSVVVTKKGHFCCCDLNVDRPTHNCSHRLSYHDSLTCVQSIVTQTDKIPSLLFPRFQQSGGKLSPSVKQSPLKDIKAFCMEDLKILSEEQISHSFHLY